jgi:hypothetical protein
MRQLPIYVSVRLYDKLMLVQLDDVGHCIVVSIVFSWFQLLCYRASSPFASRRLLTRPTRALPSARSCTNGVTLRSIPADGPFPRPHSFVS